jgi:RNA polymerase sigma factor (sigma-70 family)
MTGQGALLDCGAGCELVQWQREFQSALLAALARAGRGADERAEAIQDLWLRLLQAPPPDDVLSDRPRLLAWLTGAARRRLLDRLRRERRRRQTSLTDLPLLAPTAPKEREAMALRVHHVLASMATGRDAAATSLLELRFLDGLGVAEISERLRISPRAVSARLQRAKRKFRNAWIAGEGGGIIPSKPVATVPADFRVTFPRFVRLPPGDSIS